MAQKRSSRRQKSLAARVPNSLGNAAKGILDNPLARELVAAALVRVAAMLIENQSARGSVTRRVMSGLGNVGKRAGRLGGITMGQALDMLYTYWPEPEEEEEADATERKTTRAKKRPRKSPSKANRRSERGRRGGGDDSLAADEVATAM